MIMTYPSRVCLIVGGSSSFAAQIVPYLLDDGVTKIYLSCFASPDRAERIRNLEPNRIVVRVCDVRSGNAVDELFEEVCNIAADLNAELSVLYCCGVWRHGFFHTMTQSSLEEAWRIGVAAPHHLACCTARATQFIRRFGVVTGLGGERNHLAGNSIYAIICDSITALISSLGDECMTHPEIGRMTTMGVALGLVDNGQPWLADLGVRFGQRASPNFTEGARLLSEFFAARLDGANGRVLELPGTLRSYENLLKVRADYGRSS
jgi:NAD(P)-dependent dehydrogenase (short-subunit alcohol dehydrogenase family)